VVDLYRTLTSSGIRANLLSDWGSYSPMAARKALESWRKVVMAKATEEKGVVTLCGVQSCCPTVDFTDPQKVLIKDDFGGQVQLTSAQWDDLKAKFAQASNKAA